jgi:hypothetical protein
MPAVGLIMPGSHRSVQVRNKTRADDQNFHGRGPSVLVVVTRQRETGDRPNSLMNLCISSKFLLAIASHGDG